MDRGAVIIHIKSYIFSDFFFFSELNLPDAHRKGGAEARRPKVVATIFPEEYSPGIFPRNIPRGIFPRNIPRGLYLFLV